jgi:hypothetical protein
MELTILKKLEGSVKVIATVIAIACFLTPVGSIAHDFLFDQFYLYDVPYFDQGDTYWCGPASMSMVLGYWGTNISKGDIATEIFDPIAKITYMMDMVSYPTTYGLDSQEFTGSIYDLKTWINHGVPLIVLQRFSLENPYGHYRVVVGYSDSSAVMFTFDPRNGINFTISYAEFARLWQPGSTFSTANWTLAITPENDVFTGLMKHHQISMNLQRSNYDELMLEIEELRNELGQVRNETTFYVNLFATTTIILIVVIMLLGVYIATRKPKISSPESKLSQRTNSVA